VDGIGDLRGKIRERVGDKVRLKLVPLGGGGLLGRLRRLPSLVGGDRAAAATDGLAFADDLISAVEARALWSRFGL